MEHIQDELRNCTTDLETLVEKWVTERKIDLDMANEMDMVVDALGTIKKHMGAVQ